MCSLSLQAQIDCNWQLTCNIPQHLQYRKGSGSHLSKLGEGKQCVPVVRLMVSQVSVPVECVLGGNQLGSAVPALGLKSGQTCSRQASIERRMLRQSLACMQTDLKYLSISKLSCDVSCLCCCRCHSSSSSSDSLLSSLCDCLCCLRPFFSIHVARISVRATNTAQSLRKLTTGKTIRQAICMCGSCDGVTSRTNRAHAHTCYCTH